MLIDGIMLTDTSNVSNMQTESGPAFPSNPKQGRIFYLNTSTSQYQQGLYFYDGSNWIIGDISSVDVGANSGLTGGGGRGDVSLAVDPTKFTTTANFNAHVNDTQRHLSPWASALIAGLSIQLTSTHLNHLVGIRSNVQIQLDNKLSLTGGTMTGPLILPGDPPFPLSPATKSYVDSKVMGIDAKNSVRVVTSGPIALQGLQSIDGYQLVEGDRVLVRLQTDMKTNGIYIASSGVWTRSPDANSNDNFTSGIYIFVETGTTYGATAWVCTDTSINLGYTDIHFVQFSGMNGNSYNAGPGLILQGGTFSAQSVDSSRILINGSGIDLGAVGNPGTFNRVSVDNYGRVLVGTLENYLLANQQITLSGDATGTGNTAITVTLANSGVSAGTYKSVTVDTKGRVTSGTNPTTLAGYGITDGAPLSHVGSSGVSQHALATTSVAGFLSASDKSKLDGIATGTTGYTYGTLSDGTNTANPTSTNNVLKFLSSNGLLSILVTDNYSGSDDAVTFTVNESSIQIGNIAGTLAISKGGTGATDAPTARTNLGLGTMSTQNATSVAITGGTIDGIVIDGGTY